MWSVSGASVAGKSHTAVGSGSDDAYSYILVNGGDSVVAAVADGAGSETGTSAWGSYTACQVVKQHATELVKYAASEATARLAIEKLFLQVILAIERRSRRMDLSPKALSTTLTVAVLSPNAAVFAQVGDGIIVCDFEGKPSARIPEAKGEYANETVFVTSSGALDGHLRFEYIRGGRNSFAISTDGLSYKILNKQQGGTAYAPFFVSIWKQLTVPSVVTTKSLETFLDKLDDQTGDDKTLVVGTRTDPEAFTEHSSSWSQGESASPFGTDQYESTSSSHIVVVNTLQEKNAPFAATDVVPESRDRMDERRTLTQRVLYWFRCFMRFVGG
ncbi:PP2C family serine/threonine-protein phosphatase [Actinomyces qiguomingii]|uniref:PP2C family serine/threonine-protein phosphatase n=1 Tax=Actinomyces qiguomingii TaxID=2057800 RepID=UPI001304F3B4|nr:PP2C family serine/threonine-protein phosphatase [Actinomyces qiguomingii]